MILNDASHVCGCTFEKNCFSLSNSKAPKKLLFCASKIRLTRECFENTKLDFRVGSLITEYHCRIIKLIPWADVLIPPDTLHIKYFITNIIRMTLQHMMMLNDANHICHAHSRKLNQFVKFKGTEELAARLRFQNQTTLENVLNMLN